MSDLTLGEIGKQFNATLNTIDTTQSPPAQVPLDLTGATVTLNWAITDPSFPAKVPDKTVTMNIVSAPLGQVSYSFAAGDLVKTPEMNKNGVFRFSIVVTYPGGIKKLFTNSDGLLTIKDDSIL